MSAEWYCRIKGIVLGPITALEVKRWAESGRLAATDLVRKTEAGRWAPASAVKGLTFGPAVAPPPSHQDAEEDDGVIGFAEPEESVIAPKKRRLRAASPILDVAVGPTGVVAVCTSGWVGWWDPSSWELIGEWQGPAGAVGHVAVSPQAARAVVAVEATTGLFGMGRETRLVVVRPDRDSVTALDTLAGGGLSALAVHADGREVAAVTGRSAVRYWNSGDRKRADVAVKGHTHQLHLEKNLLAVGDASGGVAVWSLASGKRRLGLTKGSQERPACPCAARTLSFTASGDRLLTCSGKYFHRTYKDGVFIGFMVGDVPGALYGAFMKAQEEAAIQAEIARVTTLRYWDLTDGALVMDWMSLTQDYPESLAGAALSPDGLRVLGVGCDDYVRAWGIPVGDRSGLVFSFDREVVRKKKGLKLAPSAEVGIRRVAFTADGSHAIVAVVGDSELYVVPWPASL